MKYLSLFSGIGCGDSAFQHLLGHQCKGYVEYEKYCQKVIKQRIKDGVLDAAPIFGDIREFNRGGYAERYRGMVDIVIGGFPCQPFSVAGKRNGANDARNMWPATIETIKIIKPKYAFLENVPGLLSQGSEVDEVTGESVPYYGTILRDLVESGYHARWEVLSAAEVGAPHLRKRLWILAYTDKKQLYGTIKIRQSAIKSCDVPNSNSNKSAQSKRGQQDKRRWTCNGNQRNGIDVLLPGRPRHFESRLGGMADGPPDRMVSKWPDEPGSIPRLAGRVRNRTARLKAIGNGQVPLQAAVAWRELLKTKRKRMKKGGKSGRK